MSGSFLMNTSSQERATTKAFTQMSNFAHTSNDLSGKDLPKLDGAGAHAKLNELKAKYAQL